MLRRLCCWSTLLIFVSAAAAQPAQPKEGGQQNPAAEAQQGPPVKKGRLLESEVKGKLTTLKVETTEGESYDVKVTPQIDFYVVGKGDVGFVRPGVYVTGRGVKTNDRIFVKKVTVVLLPKGKRSPPGRVQKASVQEGESLQTYDFSGEIVNAGPAADYPDHTALNLKVAGRAAPVWLEPNFQVEIYTSDPAMAPDGADVELGMKPLRGGKFQPVAVRVYREGEFNSTEILGEPKE